MKDEECMFRDCLKDELSLSFFSNNYIFICYFTYYDDKSIIYDCHQDCSCSRVEKMLPTLDVFSCLLVTNPASLRWKISRRSTSTLL